MAKYFGTDGIRGRTNEDGTFTPDFIKCIANAFAMFFHEKTHPTNSSYCIRKEGNLCVVIGHDTRESCSWIKDIFKTTLSTHGIQVYDIGVAPTAAISYLVATTGSCYGLVITASHNPAEYNGLKFFNNNGEKLSSEDVVLFEKLIDITVPVVEQKHHTVRSSRDPSTKNLAILPRLLKKLNSLSTDITPPSQELIGLKKWHDYMLNRFINLKHSTKKPHIILDCANGAGGDTAKFLLAQLGYKFTLINNSPDGHNINQNAYSITNAERTNQKNSLHFSFDGDADRLETYNTKKERINGDILISVLALYLKDNKQLANNTVVSTVLFNGGAEQFLKQNDISLIRTPVGDKHIMQTLKDKDLSFGGEESGHIIFRTLLPRPLEEPRFLYLGDGLITLLSVLQVISEIGISEFNLKLENIPLYPNVSHNIKSTPAQKELIKQTKFTQFLDDMQSDYPNSRIIVRPSGTEDLIRLYVEANNKKTCEILISQVLGFLQN
ncbi:MAG: hypothetical protein FWE01_00005 [Firmicutes bacterium]|nr:hypothetical protein [Bacillota bacterium]